MLIPKKLRRGDTVVVVAPSSPTIEKESDKEYIAESKRMLESVGLKVEFSNHCYSNTTGYGAIAKEKALDINDCFANPKYKALICAKGGANCNSVFDYLDYDLISRNPKILCGFSDSTSIINMIAEKTGLVTFSGPTFKSFSSWDTDYSFKKFVKRFMENDMSLCDEDDNFEIINPGKAVGELIGGNLSLTTKMITGKYKLNFDNKILFMEELGFESDPEMCSGNLYFMKQNGVFDKIKGIWVGNYEHEKGIALERILLDVLEGEYSLPIIKSNNFGHTDKKIVIPIGTMAKIDTNVDRKIELLEKCVK